jgi:hypothetical protein
MDPNRFKREESEYQRKLSTPSMVSPLHPHPGPSHLHGSHQSSPASAVPGSLAGLLSPPESRRTSGDEKDVYKQAARQSLPSISEALGAEQTLPYPGPVPPPPSAPAPSSQHYAPVTATTSPSDSRKRPFEPDSYSAQGPANPFSHPRSPYIGAPASQVPRPPYEPQPYSTQQHSSRLPSLHPIKTIRSPPPPVARPNPPYSSYPPAPTPAYEPPAPPPAEPMNQYGYSQPQYASYPPSAPAPPGPPAAYPPSTAAYPPPSRYYPTSLRDNTEARLEEKKLNRASLAPYGESVKRHLDSFDLEASLNEVCINKVFCSSPC